MVKMLQSDFSIKKLRCSVISVTEEEFKTLVLKVDQLFVDQCLQTLGYHGGATAILLKQQHRSVVYVWLETCITLGA